MVALQRAVGNRATAAALQQCVVQRANGARPTAFSTSGSRKDDIGCKVETDHRWQSTTGQMPDLTDVQQREKVIFGSDPRIDMPAYNTPPPGITLNGNELTKVAGTMQGGGATDVHSGAAHATAFTFGAAANLRKAPWTLVGTQYYQWRRPHGAWHRLHKSPFTITRTMQQGPGAQWQLTIRKQGPGVNIAAGPTPIYDMVTSLAMGDIRAARVDQTAEWLQERTIITNLGLGFKRLDKQTLVAPNAAKTKVEILYEYTVPVASPASAQAAFYELPSSELKRVRDEAKAGSKLVRDVLESATPPTRIVFTLAINTGTVRQQAWWTNENGGTYRVLLRADKALNTKEHITGSVPGAAATAAAATKAKDKDKLKAATSCYARGSAVHELGHMLHAIQSPDRFLSAGLLQPLPPAPIGADPLRPQKEQVATINSQVMAALNQQNLPGRWAYAILNGNPSEVVAEVFTALMSTSVSSAATDVPSSLAAVYVAYGGHRSTDIDAKLRAIFAGPIPIMSQPQDALALM